MTATPHHRNDDRFEHFIRLLDRDLFPEPHRFGDEAGRMRREILKLGDDCPWSLRRLKEDLKDMRGGRDSKLVALRECVRRSEFEELKDGRGKLLLLTEHRDTLDYLREHLEAWGYSTCQIHGGMNPRERKQARRGSPLRRSGKRRRAGGARPARGRSVTGALTQRKSCRTCA